MLFVCFTDASREQHTHYWLVCATRLSVGCFHRSTLLEALVEHASVLGSNVPPNRTRQKYTGARSRCLLPLTKQSLLQEVVYREEAYTLDVSELKHWNLTCRRPAVLTAKLRRVT